MAEERQEHANRFGADPLAFFRSVYQEPAPWDIGAPQPDMVALLEEYPPRGPVLDVGCGSGDLAIHLAALGLETFGIDFVDRAIAQAQSKRAELPPEVAGRLDFRVADALHPSRLNRSFAAVVDSGFYHLFDPDECERYVEDLALALQPGGRCYLHEFAITFPIPNVPRQVTEEELRARFTPRRGWRILTIRAGEFLSRVAPVPAVLACVEHTGRSA
jgi:SAM-dependent methyltransferase